MKDHIALYFVLLSVVLLSLPGLSSAQRGSFKAPAVYSLRQSSVQNAPAPAYGTGKDSSNQAEKNVAAITAEKYSNRRDSLLLKKMDSLKALISARDTAMQTDTLLLRELAAMRIELFQMKSYLGDQQQQARYRQLNYQEDSIKNRKMRLLAAYPVSKRDYQQLHIYELQLDSLRAEKRKVHPIDRSGPDSLPVYSGDPADYRARRPAPAYPSIPEERNPPPSLYENDRADYSDPETHWPDSTRQKFQQPDSSQKYTRPVYVQPPPSGNVQAAPRRQPDTVYAPRHQPDTVYTSLPDSSVTLLNARLQRNNDSLASLKRQFQAARDSAAYYRTRTTSAADPASPDTVVKKRSWYQRMFSHPEKEQTVPDTNAARSKSPAYYNSPAPSGAPSPDTVVKKRSWYQRMFSHPEKEQTVPDTNAARSQSPAYYNSPAPSVNPSPDTVVKKRSWYQRMFSHPEKQQPAPAYNSYMEQRDRQYDDRSARLQSQMDEMQRDNDRLQRSYEQALADQARHRSQVNVTPPPVTIYPGNDGGGANREDVREMREELAALRREVDNNNNNTAHVNPVPADSAMATGQDTAQLNDMKMEIARLRQQVDSLHAAKPVTPDKGNEPSRTDILNYPVVSLYFLTNAATLKEDQIDKLTPLAAVAGKSSKIKISLKASTDPVGNRAANKAIATQRTSYVRSLLTGRFGLAEERLISLDPVIRSSGSSKKVNPLDRKVDVKLAY